MQEKLTTEEREIALRLQHLKDRAIDDLEVEKACTETTYKNLLPDLVARVSTITGINQKTLIDCAVKATFHHTGMKWYQFLDALYVFYLRMEEQKEK